MESQENKHRIPITIKKQDGSVVTHVDASVNVNTFGMEADCRFSNGVPPMYLTATIIDDGAGWDWSVNDNHIYSEYADVISEGIEHELNRINGALSNPST